MMSRKIPEEKRTKENQRPALTILKGVIRADCQTATRQVAQKNKCQFVPEKKEPRLIPIEPKKRSWGATQ